MGLRTPCIHYNRTSLLEPVVKLAPEIKHLTNLTKMVAYQAESQLLEAIAPYYARVEDARG